MSCARTVLYVYVDGRIAEHGHGSNSARAFLFYPQPRWMTGPARRDAGVTTADTELINTSDPHNGAFGLGLATSGTTLVRGVMTGRQRRLEAFGGIR